MAQPAMDMTQLCLTARTRQRTCCLRPYTVDVLRTHQLSLLALKGIEQRPVPLKSAFVSPGIVDAYPGYQIVQILILLLGKLNFSGSQGRARQCAMQTSMPGFRKISSSHSPRIGSIMSA